MDFLFCFVLLCCICCCCFHFCFVLCCALLVVCLFLYADLLCFQIYGFLLKLILTLFLEDCFIFFSCNTIVTFHSRVILKAFCKKLLQPKKTNQTKNQNKNNNKKQLRDYIIIAVINNNID